MTRRSTAARLLTARDVAYIINVHMNTVRRWSNQGILKTYRIGSRGDRRFEKEDIHDFLRRRSMIIDTKENREC